MGIPSGWKEHTSQLQILGLGDTANPAEYSAIIKNIKRRSVESLASGGNYGRPYENWDIRPVTDARTGEIQLYETQIGTGDRLLGTYSPQEAKWAPNKDQEPRWNSYFSPELNRHAEEQLNRITSITKARTVEIAEAIVKDKKLAEKTGLTDATVTALKNTPGYQSQNNTATKDSVSKEELEKQRLAREAEIAKTNVDPLAPNVDGRLSNQDNQGDSPEIGLPKELENIQERPKYKTNMRYPIDLVDSFQDYLKIQMVKYKPRGLANADGSLALPSRPNTPGDREILSTIFLPIPGGISDNNNVDWSKADMGMLSSALGNIAMSAFTGGDALKKTSEGLADAAANNTSGIKIALAKKIVENIAGVDPLKRTLGAVINTNAELLFNGPNLRQFSFTYKFSPRSDGEAKEVRNIIRTLKQGMSAKKANNFLFIKSPHTFFLSYQHKNQDHPFLNKFKECALTALSVNYTPDGNYATYYDGSMISYQVTMSFQELEPVFDDDYEGGAGGDQNETSIGF